MKQVKYPEHMIARFKKGTFKRIKPYLGDKYRTDFVREAVEAYLTVLESDIPTRIKPRRNLYERK